MELRARYIMYGAQGRMKKAEETALINKLRI